MKPNSTPRPPRLPVFSRIFLWVIELTPPIRRLRREIAAAEEMLLAVDDTIHLVDAAEARHADRWPSLEHVESGKALMNLRAESREVVANLRDKIAQLKAYKPMMTFARPDLSRVYLRSIYAVLDEAEAQLAAERGQ